MPDLYSVSMKSSILAKGWVNAISVIGKCVWLTDLEVKVILFRLLCYLTNQCYSLLYVENVGEL